VNQKRWFDDTAGELMREGRWAGGSGGKLNAALRFR